MKFCTMKGRSKKRQGMIYFATVKKVNVIKSIVSVIVMDRNVVRNVIVVSAKI